MFDFDELQEFPKKFQLGNPVEVHARSAVYGASQILCITIENRIFTDLIDIKVTLDLDFDIDSQKIMPEMNSGGTICTKRLFCA